MKTLTFAVVAASLAINASAHGPMHAHDRNRDQVASDSQPNTAQRLLDRRHAILEQQLRAANLTQSTVESDTSNAADKPFGQSDVTARAHVLTILIEFPDAKHTAITAEDTLNYYAGFTPEHYQTMLFDEQSYLGPNGEALISARGYFAQQSGGSFDLTGQVFGWYQASEPMAYYGGNDQSGADSNPRQLVLEAVAQAVADPAFNMADFDQKDPFDMDGDGDLNEPDGMIDHISIFHANLDEANGGVADAIWSHRWFVSDSGSAQVAPGISASTYTIQPIDAAAGVVAHEFGHDLGLPDEYDVDYSADDLGVAGSTVGSWSIMASGSYAGKIPGTEPVGYSPFAKQFLQTQYGGNWVQGLTLNSQDLSAQGQKIVLESATAKGHEVDLVRIDLPEKIVPTVQALGEQSFIATSRGEPIKGLAFALDLIAASKPIMSFKFNADLTPGQSVFFVNAYSSFGVETLPILLDDQAVDAFSGNTNGWVTATVDLTSFVNDFIFIEMVYNVQGSDTGLGLAIDDIEVLDNQQLLARFTAEESLQASQFWNLGFRVSDTNLTFPHYYLLEWRTHSGVDHALQLTSKGVYSPGLLIWYVDSSYVDGFSRPSNSTGVHPGEGWLSVVDANREIINTEIDFFDATTGMYHSSWLTPADSASQVKDAAFNTIPHITERVASLGHMLPNGQYFYNKYDVDNYSNANPSFADWDDYSNYGRPATGTKLPTYGIVINVVDQSDDGEQATINVSKIW